MGGLVSVGTSGLGRTGAATRAVDLRFWAGGGRVGAATAGGVDGAEVVAVGEVPLAVLAPFDLEHPGGGEFAQCPVDGVDRLPEPPGEQRPAGHADAAGVAVAGEDGVEPERRVGDVGVEHPLRHHGETLLSGKFSRRRLLGRCVEGPGWVSHGAPRRAASAADRDGGFAHRLLADAMEPPAPGRTPRTAAEAERARHSRAQHHLDGTGRTPSRLENRKPLHLVLLGPSWSVPVRLMPPSRETYAFAGRRPEHRPSAWPFRCRRPGRDWWRAGRSRTRRRRRR
jgi:hypothetical protein